MPVICPPVGQVQGDRQFRRRLEGHAVLHGTGRDAGGPGQNASVGHKGAQAHLGQGVPNVLLILRQIRHGLAAVCCLSSDRTGWHGYTGEESQIEFFPVPGPEWSAPGRGTPPPGAGRDHRAWGPDSRRCAPRPPARSG